MSRQRGRTPKLWRPVLPSRRDTRCGKGAGWASADSPCPITPHLTRCTTSWTLIGLCPPPYSGPPPTPPSMPPQVSPSLYSTPPPKIVPAHAETPPLAKTTDPINARAEEWLVQSLRSPNGYLDMGWARCHFAMRQRGQVALWQGSAVNFGPRSGEGTPHPRRLGPSHPPCAIPACPTPCCAVG